MGLIFFSLAVGVTMGYLLRNSPGIIKKANTLTLGGLFFLLLVMGAHLGANEEVLSGLGQMGKHAFIIALFTILGSVFMVQLASGYIQKNLKTSKKDCEVTVGDHS